LAALHGGPIRVCHEEPGPFHGRTLPLCVSSAVADELCVRTFDRESGQVLDPRPRWLDPERRSEPMKIVHCFVALAVWLGCTNAWPSEGSFNSVLDKRFTFYVGAIIYDASGEFSSTKERRPTVNIDLDDVGLDEHKITYQLAAILRLAKRWSLRFDYFRYHDSDKKTAEFDFNYDDEVFPSGARLDTEIDLDIYVLNLGFSIIHTERTRIGFGVGTHVADFTLAIAGDVTQDDNEMRIGEGDEEFFGPLPNLYVFGNYAFTEQFVLRCGGGWMSMSYKDYDGDLIFGNAFSEYWPFQHVGMGLGYRYISANIDYETKKKKENYDFQLVGPVLYLSVGF
jgi:hypothetical protein